MAMIKCPECGKEISDTAKTCTHCGVKLRRKKNVLTKIKSLMRKYQKKIKKIGRILINLKIT